MRHFGHIAVEQRSAARVFLQQDQDFADQHGIIAALRFQKNALLGRAAYRPLRETEFGLSASECCPSLLSGTKRQGNGVDQPLASAKFVSQPRLRRSPVAQNGGFGYV